ncbi:MAG: AI-2E family transporter [bacterium]
MQQARRFGEQGGWFLLVCLLLVLTLGYIVLRPFLKIFLLAMILATLSHPIYTWILRRSKGRRNLAALLACLTVLLLIIIPCLVLLGVVARESVQVYEWISEKVESGVLDQSLQRALELQKRIVPDLNLGNIEVGKTVAGLAGRASGLLVKWSTGAVMAVTTALWQFFLLLFALFYCYKDGSAFLSWVMHLTPLPRTLETEMFEKFQEVSESAFYGTFLTAVAQGALGALGFLIAGLPPLVWGVAMAVFSLVPIVGTFIIWGPASLILILTGHVAAGIFLAAWGVVVVGLCDNLLRPLLMRGKSQLHPVLIFFSLIGGISAFGPLGILLGPLAIVLIISMLRAYEEAARPYLDFMDTQ